MTSTLTKVHTQTLSHRSFSCTTQTVKPDLRQQCMVLSRYPIRLSLQGELRVAMPGTKMRSICLPQHSEPCVGEPSTGPIQVASHQRTCGKQAGPIDRFLSGWQVLEFTLAQDTYRSKPARRAKLTRSHSHPSDFVAELLPDDDNDDIPEPSARQGPYNLWRRVMGRTFH